MSDVSQDISDELLCRLSEESLEGLLEQPLVDTVGDDECLCIPPCLKSCINRALIVANQDVLLDDPFPSTVPVLVDSYHLLLRHGLSQVVFLTAVGLFEVVHVLEEIECLFVLHPHESLCLVLGALLFLVASCEVALFPCVLLDLLYYLSLVEAQILVNLVLSHFLGLEKSSKFGVIDDFIKGSLQQVFDRLEFPPDGVIFFDFRESVLNQSRSSLLRVGGDDIVSQELGGSRNAVPLWNIAE